MNGYVTPMKAKANSRRVDLDVPEDGFIDHEKRTVDCETWAEAGGTVSIYARHGYRPVSIGIE